MDSQVSFEVKVWDFSAEEVYTYLFKEREDALTFCSVWEEDRYEAKAYEVTRREIEGHNVNG